MLLIHLNFSDLTLNNSLFCHCVFAAQYYMNGLLMCSCSVVNGIVTVTNAVLFPLHTLPVVDLLALHL